MHKNATSPEEHGGGSVPSTPHGGRPPKASLGELIPAVVQHPTIVLGALGVGLIATKILMVSGQSLQTATAITGNSNPLDTTAKILALASGPVSTAIFLAAAGYLLGSRSTLKERREIYRRTRSEEQETAAGSFMPIWVVPLMLLASVIAFEQRSLTWTMARSMPPALLAPLALAAIALVLAAVQRGTRRDRIFHTIDRPVIIVEQYFGGLGLLKISFLMAMLTLIVLPFIDSTPWVPLEAYEIDSSAAECPGFEPSISGYSFGSDTTHFLLMTEEEHDLVYVPVSCVTGRWNA